MIFKIGQEVKFSFNPAISSGDRHGQIVGTSKSRGAYFVASACADSLAFGLPSLEGCRERVKRLIRYPEEYIFHPKILLFNQQFFIYYLDKRVIEKLPFKEYEF